MESKRVIVKPKEGLKMRDPVTMQWIPAEGMEVEHDTFWVRQEMHGCVTILSVPMSEQDATPRAEPKKKETR